MTEKQPDVHNRYRSEDMTFDWVTTNGNIEQAKLIKEALRTVHDPEIHINVHDLGLIYKMDVDNDNNVDIIMTLTSAFCPVAGEMPKWVKEALRATDVWVGNDGGAFADNGEGTLSLRAGAY